MMPLLKKIFFVILILQLAPHALINLKDLIVDFIKPKEEVGFLKFQGMMMDSEPYIQQIQKFLKDARIKALLIKIDSPGGASGTAQAIFSEIKKFKEKKPVIAFVENVCGSGAYYAASAATHLFANPSSVIGSIGVLYGMAGMPIPRLKERMDEWKISFTYIQSGKYKTAGDMFKAISNEERIYLQGLVDNTYQQFVADVASQRDLSVDQDKEWADGKIFTGNQALALKLIDQIGSMQDALDEVKKRAKISGEIKLVEPRKTTGLMALITGEQGYRSESMSGLGRLFASMVKCIISPAEQEVLAPIHETYGLF